MLKVPNVSISGLPFAISIVVPFLNMTKQFAGNINQVSQQVNAVVMGMAGASVIFDLIDEEPEADEGYVTLVRAKKKRTESFGNVRNVPECGRGNIRTARRERSLIRS